MRRGRPRNALARAAVAAALVLASALPPRAVAQDLSLDLPVFGHTTFSMTSTTTARYRGDNYDFNTHDDRFGSLAQRFDLALQGDELRLEVRIDAFVPTTYLADPCAPGTESLCYLAWDLRPERMTLRWEHENWLVEAGDSQLVLGRSIALAFRKVDLLGVDTALRGAHVRYQGQYVRARLHAGVANPQNQDPIDLSIIREFSDVVTAGTLGATLPGETRIDLGLHAANLWFADEPIGGFAQPPNRMVSIAGWSAEAPALLDGRLALYVENDALRRVWGAQGSGEQEFGRATYASAQLSLDELTVLVEWKDYDNFLVAGSTDESRAWRIYGAAPSIEYEGPQRLRAIGNQRGGGVRVDYAFLPGPWSFSINEVAYGLNEELREDPWSGVLVSHTWATLVRRQEYAESLIWSLNFVLGWREEVLLHDPVLMPGHRAGELDRRMIHGQVEVTLGSGDHSFDIHVDHRHETQLDFSGYRQFQVGGTSVTYTFGVPLTATVGLRWSDYNLGEVTQRSMRDYNFLGGNMYPSVEVRYSFDPGTSLRLFAGQTPGGQICSGGVCRVVPPFEGVLLQFVGRL